jgi:hypothetical protein
MYMHGIYRKYGFQKVQAPARDSELPDERERKKRAEEGQSKLKG